MMMSLEEKSSNPVSVVRKFIHDYFTNRVMK